MSNNRIRVEDSEVVWFITSRTNRSELWFINNKRLVERMKAYLAKYQEKYGVIIYGHIVMGNHYHLVARFPQNNKAAFMRDLNSITAALVKRYQEDFIGGKLIGRPHDPLPLLDDASIEDKFLYTVLNPVSSGIVERLGDYPDSYGTFDAIAGINRTFKIVDWRKYRDKKRYNKELTPKDFERTYTLRYTRLPGYEGLSQKEYEKFFREKIEARRLKLVEERRSEGKGFLGLKKLKEQRPGQRPRTTKTSTEHSFRPLVQCVCPKLRAEYVSFYFDTVAAFRACVEMLKQGVKDVLFPSGTYPPRLLVPV
jgi:putative transposase